MRIKVLVGVGLLLAAVPLAGQQQGQLAVNVDVLSTPAVGVTYHLTDVMAVRPTLRFDRTETENVVSDGASFQLTRLTAGVGADLLWYLAGDSDLRAYWGIGANFAVLDNSLSGTNLPPGFTVPQANDGSQVGAAALIGFQLPVVSQLHIMGEISLGYSRIDLGELVGSTNEIGLSTSALGVLFYLR